MALILLPRLRGPQGRSARGDKLWSLYTYPMTNSGLIVFLPLVGAILGAVVGAFGGAWANSWYRDREAKKAEDREREGLLLLLHTEIQYNKLLLDLSLERLVETEVVATDYPLTAQDFATLRTATWTDAKVRLVPLLNKEHRAALILYY